MVGNTQAQSPDGILHLVIRVADCAQREEAGQYTSRSAQLPMNHVFQEGTPPEGSSLPKQHQQLDATHEPGEGGSSPSNRKC